MSDLKEEVELNHKEKFQKTREILKLLISMILFSVSIVSMFEVITLTMIPYSVGLGLLIIASLSFYVSAYLFVVLVKKH